MATLTTNISNVSLTVSGTTQKSATISWTCPSVPSGMTISSCTLTGTATSSMSKGSATITVNGTSVSSGSNFTINLGTGNTTSSVTATTKGSNKNAAGTVTFNNLVYTVNYTEPVVTYTVKFVDWDGTVLKTQTVESGKSATAPSNPSRTGYAFTGWDKSFTNIASDLTVTAQYEIIKYTVTFVDYDGSVLKTEEVSHGSSASAPSNPSRVGYKFAGWDKSFNNIISNITISAQYIEIITILKIKENNIWLDVLKIYKKESGIWHEQDINSQNLFNLNDSYFKKDINIAILYSDGYFVFLNDYHVDSSHGDIISFYTGWDSDVPYAASSSPWYNNRSNIVTVYFNNVKPKNTAYWFERCNNIINLDLSNLDTSNVTNMQSMFYYCNNLTSLDLSNFDTSNVTNMYNMFVSCSSLTSLDLSNFDTSNVTNMYNMFNACSSLTSLDLSNFDTSNVIDMQSMFRSCNNLTSLDLSNFDTSNVTNMYNMFRRCSSLTSLDLSSFDTSKVAGMYYMFMDCSSLTSLDLSSFDTSKVLTMESMFDGCSSLTSLDLSSFDIRENCSTTDMFNGCTNPNLTIYVKDEATKTKIESSSGFPTTATVVIGSPN